MKNLSLLKSQLDGVRAEHHKNTGKRDQIKETIETLEASVAEGRRRGLMLEEELQVILKAGIRQVEVAASTLENAANFSIANILPPEYKSFNIELDKTSKSITANFILKKDVDGIIYDANPIEDNGGGVCDILNSSLKLAALVGYTPSIEGPLVADEPTKHLSTGYRDSLSQTFRDLSEISGRQVIMVTHDQTLTLHSDNVIQLK